MHVAQVESASTPVLAEITAAEQAERGEHRALLVDRLEPSPFNHRQRFHPERLRELADSIVAQGVQHDLLVRPLGEDRWEVVFGERRRRAALLAGVATVPCRIQPLTDAQAIELQAAENFQREDPHPLEEGHAYRSLLELEEGARYDVPTIAAKVGKSESYVYSRLRLTDLVPEIAAAFLDDRLQLGHALLIAKLPPQYQGQAFGAAFRTVWLGEGQTQVAVPVKELAGWIERNLLLALDAVPFDTDDAGLLPEAGSCVDCPKRTGYNALLFPEVREDKCTDAECFRMKLDLHVAGTVQQRPDLVQISTVVYRGGAGEPLGRDQYVAVQPLAVEPGQQERDRPKEQRACDHLQDALAMDGSRRGHLVAVCTEAHCPVHGRPLPPPPTAEEVEAEAAQRRADEERRAEETRQWEAEQARRTAERQHADEERQRAAAERERQFAAVLAKVPAPLRKADLALVALALVGGLDHGCLQMLHGRQGWEHAHENDEALARRLHALDEAGLCRLLVETALVEAVADPDAEEAHARLATLAKRYRVGEHGKSNTQGRGTRKRTGGAAKPTPIAAGKKAKKAVAR